MEFESDRFIQIRWILSIFYRSEIWWI